jgi:hypothetical protein
LDTSHHFTSCRYRNNTRCLLRVVDAVEAGAAVVMVAVDVAVMEAIVGAVGMAVGMAAAAVVVGSSNCRIVLTLAADRTASTCKSTDCLIRADSSPLSEQPN